MLKTFYVDWHTHIGVGSEYYHGREKVSLNCDGTEPSEDLENIAIERGIDQVWRRAFTDHNKGHIIVEDVNAA